MQAAPSSLITERQLQQLPHRARVAFAVRCGWRLLPLTAAELDVGSRQLPAIALSAAAFFSTGERFELKPLFYAFQSLLNSFPVDDGPESIRQLVLSSGSGAYRCFD